jgi:hypothetical protein
MVFRAPRNSGRSRTHGDLDGERMDISGSKDLIVHPVEASVALLSLQAIL